VVIAWRTIPADIGLVIGAFRDSAEK